MNSFSNQLKHLSDSGEIKFSRATEQYHFKGKTKGLALKYVAEGQECYLVNGEFVTVEKGQFILLRQGEYYEAFAQRKTKEIKGVCIDIIPGNIGKSIVDLNESKLLYNTVFACGFSTDLGNCFQQKKYDNDFTSGRGEEFLSILTNNLVSFFDEIRRMEYCLSRQSRKIITQKNLLTKLFLARDFICKEYTSKITLNHLAKVSGISKYHFARLFKYCFEKSPFEIQNELRMEKARILVQNQQYNLSEIAFMLGYSDLPSFSRRLKKFYGTSPSMFFKQ